MSISSIAAPQVTLPRTQVTAATSRSVTVQATARQPPPANIVANNPAAALLVARGQLHVKA
jgi:hypothetical protein